MLPLQMKAKSLRTFAYYKVAGKKVRTQEQIFGCLILVRGLVRAVGGDDTAASFSSWSVLQFCSMHVMLQY